MSDEPSAALVDALLDAQRLGFLGSRPIPEVIEHARGFVRALRARESDRVIESVLDLGSGGGVPGLIIAHDFPALHLTLLDRRAKRTDALERVVRRLGWQNRITVACTDVTTFVPDAPFDDFKVERFEVLNGLGEGRTLVAGTRVKLVTG